jgi:hypothetical protein
MDVVTQWKIIDKVISITTDNAAAVLSCVDSIIATMCTRTTRKFSMVSTRCLGHIFHLIFGKVSKLELDGKFVSNKVCEILFLFLVYL